MHVSPVLAAQGTYPFVRIERAKREAADAGIEILDFGQGDPREPTDPLIRQALVDALEERDGLPEGRGAARAPRGDRGLVRAPLRRRARPGHRGDPDLREQGGDLQLRAARPRPRRRRRTPSSSPSPATRCPRAARRSPARGSSRCRCSSGTASSPTSTRWRTGTASRSSGSTTRTTRPARSRRSRSTSASPGSPREHGFLLCSDEAYSELWFTEPPRSALELADRTNVVVFQTLSKRSSMTGYRSGFVAATPEIVSALKTYRPSTGAAPQEFVQRASVVAWNDEAHVERTREAYRRKREVLLGVLGAEGLARGGERGDDVPLGRGAGRRELGGVRASGCSGTASSSPPARTSATPARATSGSRSSPRSRSASARRRSSRRSCDAPPRRSPRSTAARCGSPSAPATTGS